MKSSRATILILSAILLLAAGLRVAGAMDELWLDEAWSGLIARACHSPMGILLSPEARVDNNHPLNTLWMYLLYSKVPWMVYRIPAIISGVASVFLAWRIALRTLGNDLTAAIRQSLPAMVAALVLAISYPSVLYSSEARGYAPAILFSLLCFRLLVLGVSNLKVQIVYALFSLLGLLSHLTFIHFVIAAAAYTYFSTRRDLRQTVRWHAAPIIFCAAMYFGFIQHLHIAGGPASSVLRVVVDTAALFVGWDGRVAAALFFLVLTIYIVRLIRRRDPLMYFVVAILISPFIVLAAKTVLLGHAEIVYVRYFLIPATFILVLGSAEMARMAIESSRTIPFVAGYFLYFVIANSSQLWEFLPLGRGEPLTAFRYIIGSRTDSMIYVTTLWPDEPGQHDFRARRLLDFYEPYLPEHPKLILMRPTTSAAEWLLVSSTTGEATPALQLIDNTYLLQKVFPHYGLSGWTWCAYRRADLIR